MSGPVGMSLGPFAFEGIGFGYDGLSRKINTQWADIAVAQSLNQQQWTGPTSEEVTIKGVLFPAEYGGQESLDGIIASANTGTPMVLISGDAAQGFVHGTYTVQSVDQDGSHHTRFGTARKNSYAITIKKYGGTTEGGAVSSLLSLFG